MRVAVLNAAFQLGGNRAMIRAVCAEADLVLVVEAKDFSAGELVPAGWRAIQDTSGADRAGCAVLMREAVVTRAGDPEWTATSGPLPGMLRRWTLAVPVAAEGRTGTVVVSHVPPERRGALRPVYARARTNHMRRLAEVLAKHERVILGADVNMAPLVAADRLGLEGRGADVMLLGWDGANVTKFAARKVDGSDHHALTADVLFKEAAVPKPYDLTTYDGRRVDWLTRQALEAVAKELNYADGVISLTQGSYNKGGVSASAGTHDGGGVVDIRAYDYERKVRVLRKHGFAAWYRPAIKGLWPAHIHAVQVGNEKLSRAAENQVTAYLAGRNGLANNGPDDGPREYVGRRWTWQVPTPPAPPVVGRPSRGIKVDQALSLLRDAADHADGKGWKWRAKTIRAAVTVLERLPVR